MPRARSTSASLLAVLVVISAAPAAAQGEPRTGEPPDQVVLSGAVVVRRGEEVGEVVVLHGNASVAGVAHGDVVVVDGRIVVTGQVSGSVVSASGPVTIGPNAHVLGDVLARGRVRIARGAVVDGAVRRGIAFTFRTPIDALGRFAPWVAIWASVLALGLVLVLIAPRAGDATALAARGSPWATLGWGALAFLALPVAGIVGVLTLVWLPLGLGLLLATFLIYSIGLVWSAFALGRSLWREPRGRVLAFAMGWAILAAIAFVPYVGGVVWVAGSVFGLGAMMIATWRSRGAGGRHRPGAKMPAGVVPESLGPRPMVTERPMGQEGAGL
jgi:hypothetical protein